MVAAVVCVTAMGELAVADEHQITFSAKNHMLDNNDNFSPDSRLLVYDTRETIGPGIDNSQSIEMVDIHSGVETILYKPEKTITGAQAAPGIGAASFSPIALEVMFIHGPPPETVDDRGFYGKPNRNGAIVPADGTQTRQWVDHRDVQSSTTPPGAHRGGTHRHEYSRDGKRVGFTYDDHLLPSYDRNIGFMVPHALAPGAASHYFALLVETVPMGTAKTGEIEKAYGDSWVGREGLTRAFIGKVKEANGEYVESLFVVEIPADIDITTADSGTLSRYPKPPKGLTVRRLTHSMAYGIARGTDDGNSIVYIAEADGVKQLFTIPTSGSDQADDEALRPRQLTDVAGGIPDDTPGGRWHPSGAYVAFMHDDGVAVTRVSDRKTIYVTPHGDGILRDQICWAPDGHSIAYNRPVETNGDDGTVAKTYNGLDFTQIFIAPFRESALPGATVGDS